MTKLNAGTTQWSATDTATVFIRRSWLWCIIWSSKPTLVMNRRNCPWDSEIIGRKRKVPGIAAFTESGRSGLLALGATNADGVELLGTVKIALAASMTGELEAAKDSLNSWIFVALGKMIDRVRDKGSVAEVNAGVWLIHCRDSMEALVPRQERLSNMRPVVVSWIRTSLSDVRKER